MMGSRSDTSVEKLFTTALYPLQGTAHQLTFTVLPEAPH